MMQVAGLIAEFLFKRGVDRVFSLCGGHILPIWDHLRRLGIRIIDVRDERAAVHMAQAHRELTGSPGVAMVTAGPGMTNAMTGIANAHVCRVRLLIISGVPPRPQQYMAALQAVPHADIVRHVTRYARTVWRVEHVLRELDEAMACAEGHFQEPGPAFIDFPTDLLREEVPEAFIENVRFKPRGPLVFPPLQADVEAAVNALWGSRRPLIIAGRGARGAGEQIIRLLNALDCVYLDTAESRGLVPEDHPSLMPAMRARAMNEADVVMTVGRSLDFQLGYGSAAVFPNALFIRTGTTPLELRDSRRADIELAGSAAEVLTALCETALQMSPATDHAWVESMRAEDRERREKLARSMSAVPPGRDGYMHPYRLLSCLKENLNSDAVVVADGGDLLSFARVAMSGTAYLDCGPFGCLGVGVPYGIAAALAFPGRQVTVVSGDGSFGFNAIELDSCRRHGAKVLFVVANNSAWNIERNDQIENYGARIFGTELEGCDYAALARSLGVCGERVVNPDELPDAIQRGLENAPALLDVTVTRDAFSPDFLSGLAGIPEKQALSKWDKLESERLKRTND